MFSPLLDSYGPISMDSHQKESGWLSLLYSSFFTFNTGYIWVDPDENDPDIIIISMHFPDDEEDDYDPEAVLRMSRKNYEYIGKKLEQIDKQKPNYFIMSYDDNGWIDLEAKDELSQDDLKYIDQSKCEKLLQKTM